MKKNGFTLIELLATIVIMGLIIAMISPSILNLQENNKKKKFDLYGTTLEEAAKLYVSKEGVDITGLGISDWKGCVDITYQDLLDSNLIKAFADNDYDCSTSSVRLTKTASGETYTYNLICKSKKTNKKDYTSRNIPDNTCTVSQQ